MQTFTIVKYVNSSLKQLFPKSMYWLSLSGLVLWRDSNSDQMRFMPSTQIWSMCEFLVLGTLFRVVKLKTRLVEISTSWRLPVFLANFVATIRLVHQLLLQMFWLTTVVDLHSLLFRYWKRFSWDNLVRSLTAIWPSRPHTLLSQYY